MIVWPKPGHLPTKAFACRENPLDHSRRRVYLNPD
jgi:hypothetical protein